MRRPHDDASTRSGEIADLLAVGPAILDAELRAAGEALASWPPAPGEWSMKACVGHLIEAERRGFAGRIRIILAEDLADPRHLGSAGRRPRRHDDERPMDELLAEFADLRSDSVGLIRSLRSQTSTGSDAIRSSATCGPRRPGGVAASRPQPHPPGARDRAGAGLRPARQRPPVRRRRIGGRVGRQASTAAPSSGTFSGALTAIQMAQPMIPPSTGPTM